MLLSYVSKKDEDLSAKKTKPTQENEGNDSSGNEKPGMEQYNQLFNYKVTENIGEYKSNNIRKDRGGNPIVKKGKQKVTFIDKISGKKFEEIINIESFKEYNKTEEVKNKNVYNTCCFLV